MLLPKIVGIDDTLDRIDEATWYWVVIAVGFNSRRSRAYVALFRGVLGGVDNPTLQRRLDMRASYQITMAGLAATRMFSAGGAGGIALTYWALRKAGDAAAAGGLPDGRVPRAQYSRLPASRWWSSACCCAPGCCRAPTPSAARSCPLRSRAALIVLLLLVALIPQDVERRLIDFCARLPPRDARGAAGKGPATLATGVRTAIDLRRATRSRGALAVGGAVGFWAANIGVLWASFEAFGGDVPFAVLVQGFFVGMAANLIPSPAGGVGSVDAGMIGAFVLFDIPSDIVFPAVLTYRVIAFWLPIPPGIVAFFQLRKTVARWESDTSESKVKA